MTLVRDVIAAPAPLASALAGYRSHPQLLFTRSHYINHLSAYFGEEESTIRHEIVNALSTGCSNESSCNRIVQYLDDKYLDLLILQCGDGGACKKFTSFLNIAGYQQDPVGAYTFWRKNNENKGN